MAWRCRRTSTRMRPTDHQRGLRAYELRGGVGAFLPGAGAEVRAQKKRRRAQRKKARSVKQACSDTIEETTCPTEEAVALRKRARFRKGSSPVSSYAPGSTRPSISTLPSSDSRARHHSLFRQPHPSAQNRRQSRIQPSPAPASAEYPGKRRLRWNSCWRGGKSRPPQTTGTGR